MPQAANSNHEEAPKNNILASELKLETDHESPTAHNSTTDTKHPDEAEHSRKAPKNNILASELKLETDDESTATNSKHPDGAE